jgi:heat shock protein HslJ
MKVFSLTICAVLAASTILAATQANSDLTGRRWKLTEVDGVEVTRGNANLQFDANPSKYHGSSGCNFIGGNYKTAGTTIRFSESIITRRACMDTEVQKVETEFMRAFYEVTDFHVAGDVLRLYKGDQLLLVFKCSDT